MFGEITFASPDAASNTPNMPMNCHADHDASPPSAVTVRITPARFKKESTKTRASPRKARPDPRFAPVSRIGCCSAQRSCRSFCRWWRSLPNGGTPKQRTGAHGRRWHPRVGRREQPRLVERFRRRRLLHELEVGFLEDPRRAGVERDHERVGPGAAHVAEDPTHRASLDRVRLAQQPDTIAVSHSPSMTHLAQIVSAFDRPRRSDRLRLRSAAMQATPPLAEVARGLRPVGEAELEAASTAGPGRRGGS